VKLIAAADFQRLVRRVRGIRNFVDMKKIVMSPFAVIFPAVSINTFPAAPWVDVSP
jgi:hypothetical protein